MSEHTGITWCDSTFNPWMGCTKVSPACDHCYAERLMDHGMHKVQWGAGQPRVRTSGANWRQPLAWNALAFVECIGCHWRGEQMAASVVESPAGFHPPSWARICPNCQKPLLKEARRRVFCASLADVFDNEVPEEWREDLFELIDATPHLAWLLLTKRIGNAATMLPWTPGDGLPGCAPLPNVWLGATICNQEEADRDIPKLLATPAAVRFLSIEPMLGDIRLGSWLQRSPSAAYAAGRITADMPDWTRIGSTAIDWVICGGESGPHARPMHPDWVRSLRDQCAAAGVPFHFKQWGEWAPGSIHSKRKLGHWMTRSGRVEPWAGGAPRDKSEVWTLVDDVGTKHSARLLDGIEHNGVPA